MIGSVTKVSRHLNVVILNGLMNGVMNGSGLGHFISENSTAQDQEEIDIFVGRKWLITLDLYVS